MGSMEAIKFQFIKNEDDINKFYNIAINQKYIAVDTEFFTNPKSKKFILSLIQICCDNINYIIDINDFIEINNGKNKYIFPEKIKKIFENPDIIKVFHACQQDHGILKNELGIKISGIFDTQIAMMFLKIDECYSYQNLVQEFLKIKIDKAHQMDNWQIRPLTQAQLEYAAIDVFYLYQIYPLIITKLNEKKKIDWARQYMKEMECEKNQKISSYDLVKKYNITIQENEKKKYLIIESLINFFCDNKIKSLNLIKNLVEAKNLTISRIHHIFKNTSEQMTEEIIQQIFDILQQKYTDEEISTVDLSENNKNELDYNQSHIFILLKFILRKVSYENQVSPRIICDKNDLIKLMTKQRGKLNNNDWRFEIFGKIAVDFLNGKQKFEIQNGKLNFNLSV